MGDGSVLVVSFAGAGGGGFAKFDPCRTLLQSPFKYAL